MRVAQREWFTEEKALTQNYCRSHAAGRTEPFADKSVSRESSCGTDSTSVRQRKNHETSTSSHPHPLRYSDHQSRDLSPPAVSPRDALSPTGSRAPVHQPPRSMTPLSCSPLENDSQNSRRSHSRYDIPTFVFPCDWFKRNEGQDEIVPRIDSAWAFF